MKKILMVLMCAVISVSIFGIAVYAQEGASNVNAATNISEVSPTITPTVAPTAIPTVVPSNAPTVSPTNAPTSSPTTAPTASPTSNPSATPNPQTGAEQQAGITPDSPIYSLERLIESVQVALTFSTDSKAELLVSIANERLAEAEVMTEKNKQELVKKVMQAYTKTIDDAKEKIKEAVEDNKDVTAVLQEVTIIEQTADKVVIKATGVIPQEYADELKTTITNQVKGTLAVQAYVIAKSGMADAKKKVELAKDDLKSAIASNDTAKVKAAQEALIKAEQVKAQAETLKDGAEAYKEGIKEAIKEQRNDSDDEKKDDSEKIDKSEKNKWKEEKFKEKAEIMKEKFENKAEKNSKLEKKFKEKAETMKNKFEKKAEKYHK